MASIVTPLTEHYTTAGGTATATSSTSLTDGTSNWAVNSQVGRTITAGITTAVVTANTATVLTVVSWTAGTPGSTAAYSLVGWAVVVGDSGSPTASYLAGMAPVTSSDIWAVGNHGPGSVTTLTEHYNGTAWSVIPSPNPTGGTNSSLASVTAVSSSDVWAVGSTTLAGKRQSVTEHYDGTSWSIVTSPNTSTTLTNELWGVAEVSSSDVWAVGESANAGGSLQNLTEHYTTAAGTAPPPPPPP